MKKIKFKDTSVGAWTRLAVLIIAIMNQTLLMLNYSPLPFLESDIETLFSLTFLMGAGVVNWFKDNDISEVAKMKKKIANEQVDEAIRAKINSTKTIDEITDKHNNLK